MYHWRLGGGDWHKELEHGWALRLQTEDGTDRDLDAFWMPIVGQIRDLLTIAFHRFVPIDQIRLARPRDMTEDGRSVWFRLLQQGVGPREPATRRREAVFTLDDLGGPAGVGRWLAVGERFSPVVGLTMTLPGGHGLFVENRLLNIVTALEALDSLVYRGGVLPRAEYRRRVRSVTDTAHEDLRSWLSSRLEHANTPRLTDRLERSASSVLPELSALLPSVDRWARVATGLRNHFAHGRQLEDFGEAVHWVAESAYCIAVGALLVRADPSRATLTKVAASQTVAFVASVLPDALDDAEALLARRQR